MLIGNFIEIVTNNSANFDFCSLKIVEIEGLKIKIKAGKSEKDRKKDTNSP